MLSAISTPDPFAFLDSASPQQALRDTNGKTMVSSVLNGGIRNCVLLVAGQSNVCNTGATTYVLTNAGKVDNFNLCDGATYSAIGPLLGCSAQSNNGVPFGRHPAAKLADLLVSANKFDRVIIASIGVGSSLAANWQSGAPSTRISAIAKRLAARSLPVTAILWGQGETDNALAVTQAAHQASLSAIIAAFRAAGFGTNIPFFVALQTWIAGAPSAAIRAAQAAVVNHAQGVWQGPDADTLDNTNRLGGTDFSDAGVDAYAALWQTALGAFGAPF
jgi:hypothetical protein